MDKSVSLPPDAEIDTLARVSIHDPLDPTFWFEGTKALVVQKRLIKACSEVAAALGPTEEEKEERREKRDTGGPVKPATGGTTTTVLTPTCVWHGLPALIECDTCKKMIYHDTQCHKIMHTLHETSAH